GINGGFGILTPTLYDSLTFNADGYEPKSVRAKADVYQEVTLKLLSSNISSLKPKLVSITADHDTRINNKFSFSNESYSSCIENDFIKTEKFSSTAFSVRIDKASYSN